MQAIETAGGLASRTHTFIDDGAESSPPPVTLTALILTTWGENRRKEEAQQKKAETRCHIKHAEDVQKGFIAHKYSPIR